MIGTHILNNYAIEPVKIAAQYAKNHSVDQMLIVAQYARDNPISAVIYNTAEKSLEHLKSAASSAVSFGFGNPNELEQVVYKGNGTGVDGGTVVLSVFAGLSLLSIAAMVMQQYSMNKEDERRDITRLRNQMRDNWGGWENPEYGPLHPLRSLDRYPHEGELARKVAEELDKGEEFYRLVGEYRAEVGTKHLKNPNAVRRRVKDKKLEAIILGTTQTE